ncbi:MAG: TrkA family potassium uptake protein, partial [Candidatus Omnitrophica bacterium]|nr:TrkA family potassium uptake protein [Candidatus Omnitrophota bacterium]
MHVIIAGCGRVGAELAKLLSNEGHDVVIIDKNQTAFSRLGGTFNGITTIGNCFDLDLLKSAGVEKANVFCALTNGDNTNLVSAQVAKKVFNVPKVIARVYDPERAQIYQSLGLDIISGTNLFAAMLRDKIIESRFSSYLIESKDVGVIQMEIKNSLADKKVQELNIEGEFQVVAVKKIEGTIIPKPDTVLNNKDVVMAIVKTESLEK